MKKIVLLVLAICLAASLLGGCGGRNTSIGQNQSAGSVTPAQSESPAGKKTMVIGDTTFNSENWEETVDPHRTYNGWACIRYGVGETLVHYTDAMELEPWLAKSWENDGNLTWTVTLQDNVTFSSGREMDGEAVKECLDHLLEVHDRAPSDTKIVDVQAEGQVLTITTSEPNPALMNYLGDPYGCIIDVQASDFDTGIVAALLDGHGVPANGAFPDGFSAFGGEHVTTASYDPDGAKSVLEAAGWVDTDGDGIREKDGVKLVVRWLTYPSRQELPLLAESVQAALKDVGIEVDINCTANRREFLADMNSWDVYASALVTAPSGDPQYFFTTSCLPGMSYNFGAYDNPQVNALIEQLATEFDAAKRSELAIRLQQAILDDNAYVFCSFLQMSMISKSNVSNYTAHACDYYQVTADLDING